MYANQEKGNPHSYVQEEQFSIKNTEFVIGGIMLNVKIPQNFMIWILIYFYLKKESVQVKLRI